MSKKIWITHLYTVVITIVILTTGCVSKGVVPGKQCITLFKSEAESISTEVVKDKNGCIIEESVIFYGSPDCADPVKPHEFKDPERGFIFVSGIKGGCPELVEVTVSSPACVELTLKSGRKTTVCY